jgi:NAD(P)-dependent dehydrogenase (short-subunit alcohol dehydrogenase family)
MAEESSSAPVLVVTGGSRGIGAATARMAAQQGYSVGVNFRTGRNEAETVVDGIVRDGGRAIAIQADISDEADVIALFDTVERELGPVAALVNNAGTPGKRAPLRDLTLDEFRNVVDVNLIGSFLCAREAVKRMTPGGGSIINVSSTAAQSGGGGGIVAYAASKAGIETMTLGLARETGRLGIRVNAVRPGTIDTEMNAFDKNPDFLKHFSETAPLGRVGKPEEVAAAILWLMSDAASFVHGAVLTVSGGR